MIDIACPACAASYKVPEAILGKNLKCKSCQAGFIAVASAPAPISDPPALEPPAFEKAPRGRGKGLVVAFLAVFGLVLVVGLLIWFIGFGGARWEEFTSKEGGFSVLVPGTATPGKANDAKTGIEFQEVVVKPSKSGPTYTVQYADLRDKPINDYLYLSWLKHNLLASLPDGKLTEEQEIKLGSRTGKQLTLDLPDEQRLVRRMFVVENRIYVVSAQHPRTTGAEVDKFLDSFKITGDPPKVVAGKSSEPTPLPTQVAKGPSATFATPLPKATAPMPTGKAPNQPPPTPANFPISDDERAIVDQINQLRIADKKPALQLDKEVFDAARAEAAGMANKKPIPPTPFPDRNVLRLPINAFGNITPQLLIQGQANNKLFRSSMVDEGYQSIGVGIAKGAEGGAAYVIILVGAVNK